jgi:translation elongation factor EF-G
MFGVFDGAVLVISAVDEGVQAQTRVPMRAMGRPRIPALVPERRLS